jgi:hypothetical protein
MNVFCTDHKIEHFFPENPSIQVSERFEQAGQEIFLAHGSPKISKKQANVPIFFNNIPYPQNQTGARKG